MPGELAGTLTFFALLAKQQTRRKQEPIMKAENNKEDTKMSKTIDFSRSVYELVTEYPELVDIMAELGFTEIKKPAMLHSVGKLMTIPKGAKIKNIPMEKVLMALIQHGFTLSGEMPATAMDEVPETVAAVAAEEAPVSRTEQLKAYLRRLGAGESLESVRADFVENFQDVEASEIMQAEQELMREGTPLAEVQKLCDIHSALFHGATREEKIANAEKEVMASVRRAKELAAQKDYGNKNERAAVLAAIPGHPLHTLTRENAVLSGWLTEAKTKLDAHEELGELFARIRELSVHYAKKGDLLYPLLKVKYEISGPSNVMWTVDDEIRDELAELSKLDAHTPAWEERLRAVLQRAEEMIYKENNILFPICSVNFSETEWHGIYRDSLDYADCLGVKAEVWPAAEAATPAAAAPASEDEIVMPGGHMTLEQLTALLNTIPLEISFVDADNYNRFFNEGPKVFKRPGMAIDRDVFSCHPPKIEPMVRSIIDDFRNDRRDSVPVWMQKNGRIFLVTYMAVRDKTRKYLGTVEIVQDMEFAKEHFAH